MKFKRRLVSLLVMMTMLMSFMPVIVQAEIAGSGNCGADGDNVTWTLDNAGTLTISGTGDMQIGQPWLDYSNYIKSAVIEEGVSSIGMNAFIGCFNMTGISLPDSLSAIGNYAFRNCYGLTGISLPDNLSSIGEYAFQDCRALTDISIPNTVSSIGNNAFYGCSALTSVSIPNNLSSIESATFSGYSALTSVSIPDSVSSIGNYAFQKCGLTSISIPDNVSSIGNYVFYGCSSLTDISVSQNNEFYKSIDGVLFNYDNTKLLAYPVGKTQTTYAIPDGVSSVESAAFSGCPALTGVSIPDSVSSIENYAFEKCTGLTSIAIPGSVSSIGSSAFEGCTGLTSVSIPDSVSSIGASAFRKCQQLKEAAVLSKTATWGRNVFSGCSEDLIIKGYSSSTAETYAAENEHTFMAIDSTPSTATPAPPTPSPESPLPTTPTPSPDSTSTPIIPTPTPPLSLAVNAVSVDIGTPTDAYILVAQYDKEGNMLSVTKEQTFSGITDTVYNVKIPFMKCAYLKIMLWDSLSSLNPLSEALLIDME